MKSATFVCLLWLTMCGPTVVLAGNGPESEFVVPIKLYEDHLIVVRGGLGTLQERNLLIDTGAYPSAIDLEVARALKLKVNRGATHALGRDMTAGAAVISQVVVGPLQAGNLPVLVADLSKLSRDIGVRVDALIGVDVLARANFSVDYAKKEMAFGPPTQFTFSTPLESRQSMACVGMKVNGRPVQLLIDTGAAKTVLFTRRMPWLAPKGLADKSFTSLAGGIVLEQIKANSVELGGARIATEDVFLSDMTNIATLPFDGVMATWGAHFRKISFDFEHSVFSWEMEGVRRPTNPSENTELSATAHPTQAVEEFPGLAVGSVAASQRDSLTGTGVEPEQGLFPIATPSIGHAAVLGSSR